MAKNLVFTVAALALSLPYLSVAMTIPQQEIIGPLNNHVEGPHVLRRFHLRENDSTTIEEIVVAAQDIDMDIWQVGPSNVDIHIPPEQQASSNLLLSNMGLSYSDSILPESLIRPYSTQTQTATWNLSSLSNSTFHTGYRTIEEIGTFVKELLDLYPDQVRLVPIGHSSENREMFALEITARGSTLRKKTGFVITGAQHAREHNLVILVILIWFTLIACVRHEPYRPPLACEAQWIATSTATFLAHALLADPSESYSMASLLNTFDFYLILVPNPDGYVYTWETDRFWYKNRQVVGPNAKCMGIDMNRNWGHKWKPWALFPANKKKTPRTGTDPCAHWYPGHRAFEAPEVNNIANYITTLPNLRVYIDLRSYGQMTVAVELMSLVTSPFSYSCKKTPKDAEDQLEAALGASRALKAAHGTAFTTGRLCAMLYRAPGNIVDYMYAKAGVKFSYAVHLRDTGTYGFVLPPEWIRPVGEETANMIKSLAGFVVGKTYFTAAGTVQGPQSQRMPTFSEEMP
ncbi:Zn-dependent exopeptidase [Trametopsis cervina]|nr:Zn-dependent exopeptidase [Trametopsis cervina]